MRFKVIQGKGYKSSFSRGPVMQEIDHFISSVAAAKPLIGGGSVASLAGALAAALGEMMAGITEGRETFAPVQAQVIEIHSTLSGLRNELRDLAQEDSVAYRSLLNAMHLPRENEQQRALRTAAIEEHARNAIETPLHTARAALEVLGCLKTLLEIGNPHARSDVAVGAQLAYAALKSGQYNVLANIRILKDISYADQCRAEISDLLFKGFEIVQEVDRQVTGAALHKQKSANR
jgi:formiminotetrahydrofolate cyclodeaminase